jgi:hypothetical protein
MAGAISYCDVSSWEPWQAAYRFGAFFIFPPAGTIELIDALRRAHDPRSNSYCQAHISLSDPLPHPLTDDQLRDVQLAVPSMEPFEITYGPLRSFPPYPGVVYAIQPEATIAQLRRLVQGTSVFTGADAQRKYIAPHMTVAEFITLERTDQLLLELSGNVPEGKFLCSAIEYAVPNQRFYFERVLTIPLGGTRTPH